MKNARAHWGVRSLGRTHWMTDALTRRMRFLYQARMQWLRDLERAGLQPRLLILDTCVGLTVRQVRVMEATYIATYWTRTRLFNSNCPASVEGFTRFGDLVKRPATPHRATPRAPQRTGPPACKNSATRSRTETTGSRATKPAGAMRAGATCPSRRRAGWSYSGARTQAARCCGSADCNGAGPRLIPTRCPPSRRRPTRPRGMRST